jgi:hypothetical protein
MVLLRIRQCRAHIYSIHHWHQGPTTGQVAVYLQHEDGEETGAEHTRIPGWRATGQGRLLKQTKEATAQAHVGEQELCSWRTVDLLLYFGVVNQ